jgi:glycolate oxidase
MAVATLPETVVDELVAICGEDHVFTGRSALFNRARVPAPFPVHRWEEHAPQAVVLPTSAEQVSEVVKLANRHRVAVVPRAGGTGLTDGAVPLRHGILVDVKLMNAIHEIDVVDRTVTVGPGINMLKLNEALRPYGFMYPDNPASYPCSLVGGRIGTNGWSLIGSRFGHVKHLVISMEVVLPTGEIIRVGHGGPKNRSSSSGYQLKELFMGHQGTLGITAEATLELVKRPEAEFSAFWTYRSYEEAWKATADLARSGYATIAGVVLFDEEKVAYLRRDDEAYIPQPDWAKAVVAVAMYGNADEVRPGAKEMMRIGKATGGAYLGDEISHADWAARHDRYATPLHGRLRKTGQVVPMSWHCEDAAILYSKLPEVREQWHRIADRIIERYGIFDDWGMFAYTNGPYKPWGDYLAEIDIGIWEQELDEESWQGFVEAKRDIARVSIESGGSISACHGSCRAGEVDLVPLELGGAYDVMRTIKRALDPNNIMNPGKYLLDSAYAADGDEEV